MPMLHMSDSFFPGLAGWGSAAYAEFARAAAPIFVTALWQDAIVVLALVLCLRFALGISASHRFGVWLVGFGVAALLPILPFLSHSSAVIAATPAVGVAGGRAVRPWLELDSRWGFAIAAFWIAASVFRAAELVFHSLRLRKLWRGATLVQVDAPLHSLLATVLPARPIQICTTHVLDRPSVIGFFAPRILIPEWLYSKLTPGELEQVVLHESEHLRRRDDWTNLFQKLSLVLFPLNPALVWMERRLCREREMACDEGVVQRTQAPRTYAACLTSLAERGLQHREFLRRAQALSLGVLGRRPELIHRVNSILGRRQSLHPLAAGALVSAMGCGLVLGAAELSRSPQLVAFVAAHKPETQIASIAPPDGSRDIVSSHERMSDRDQTAVDAVFHPSGHDREVEIKSVVPAARSASITPIAHSSRNNESREHATTVAITDRTPAPSETPMGVAASTAPQTADHGQELLVLTTWEVETPAPQYAGRATRDVADYETGASDRSGAAGQTHPTEDQQISVTRLILLVVPANTAASSRASVTTGAATAGATSSHSHRLTSSTFDGGWLFFQL